MNGRLKRLLTVSLVVSMFVVSVFSDIGIKNADAATTIKIKKVKITVADKKTIKAPKSENKATWSVLSGKNNISILGKDKKTIKIKAEKSGKVKLQAKQGKKKTIYNITVEKQAPKKSELEQLRELYIDYFWKAQEESPYDWGWRKNSDLTKLKWFSDWVSWDDYGYVKGIVVDDMSITTPYFIGYDIEMDIKLPRFSRIKYFGSSTGNYLKSIDLGNNPSLKYFFLNQGYGEHWDEQEYHILNQINVSGCKNLEGFYISTAYCVEKLDLSQNTKLKTVNIVSLENLSELKIPQSNDLREFYINWTLINEVDLSGCKKLQRVGVMGCNAKRIILSLEEKTDKEILDFDICVDKGTSVQFVSENKTDAIPYVKYGDNMGYMNDGRSFISKCIEYTEKNGKLCIKLL